MAAVLERRELLLHSADGGGVFAQNRWLELLVMERSALRHGGDVGCLVLRRDHLNRLTGDAVVIAFVRRRECPRFDVAAGLATDQALAAPALTRNLADAELAQSETARCPKGVIQSHSRFPDDCSRQ